MIELPRQARRIAACAAGVACATGRSFAPALLSGLLCAAVPSLASAGDAKPGPTPGSSQPAAPPPATSAETVSDAATMALFLDRLMIAESGGRDDARNPLSTAVGPFQFIESTFIAVARRHFAAETDELSPAELLKLRTNRVFARRAAEAFTRDNAAHLAGAGLDATFPRLRLAHLVGPGGAIRILQAPPATPVGSILGGQVIRANPFLARMTAAALIDWSSRNLQTAALAGRSVAADPKRVAANGRASAKPPAIPVRCNRGLASCRRWVALAKQRYGRQRVAGTKQEPGGR